MTRRGLTLLELLAVIAIIALLIAILLPAVQYAREASRRAACQSNLRQIALAMAQYESVFHMYPPGAGRKNFSFHVLLLPYLEETSLYGTLDLGTIDEAANLPDVRKPQFKLICPSDAEAKAPAPNGFPGTNYAGNSGTGIEVSGPNGVFYYFTRRYPAISASDIRDGLSNTVALSEMLVGDDSGLLKRTVVHTPWTEATAPFETFASDCAGKNFLMDANGMPVGESWRIGRPWFRGEQGITFYNHVLPPGSPSCFKAELVQEGAYSANSQHSGGVNCAFCDGHVSFVSDSIALSNWRAFGSRNGSEPTF